MKHLFIINPAAGGRDSSEEISEAVKRSFAAKARGDFEIYVTKAPMDAAEKVRYEADFSDRLRVYACGGDGTLNECAGGAAGHENVELTHYPTGTANDFLKSFGEDAARFRVLEDLLDGEALPVDAISCNGRIGLNICSVGVDARIGIDVHKYSGLPVVGGAAGYVTSTAVNLFKGIHDELRVTCGGKLYYGTMSLICACNGGWYGGGFHPVPDARPDDGALDFLIVKGVSRLTFLRVIRHYARGEYADYPKYITHVRGDSMEIRAEKAIPVNMDGELIQAKTVSISLLPKAIRFVFPRGASRLEENREKETV